MLLTGTGLPERDSGLELVIIDTPPGLTAIDSLKEAHFVVIPVLPEEQGVNNFAVYLRNIDRYRVMADPGMRLVAALPIMVETRSAMHKALLPVVERVAREHQPPLAVLSPVPRRSQIRDMVLHAPFYDQPAKELWEHAIVHARDFSKEELAQTAEDTFARLVGGVLVPIERIEANPDNPRRKMAATALADLAASIAERGLLQPLVVRRNLDRVGEYIVIAGSRRLLAARQVHSDPDETIRARVAVLPCIVREESDDDAFADALLENLARSDLSRAEMMEAIVRLNQEFGWSSHYIAKRTGRNQSDLSQLLAVARHPQLAQLVRQEVIKPTVAGDINRLPEPERAAVIADVQAGTVRTSADVQRLARRLRPETPTPASATALDIQDH